MLPRVPTLDALIREAFRPLCPPEDLGGVREPKHQGTSILMRRRSWKDAEKGMDPYKLEAILRHYAEFRELYETQGIEELTLEDGLVVNIHDVLRGIDELPKRQKTALILTSL